MDAAYGRILAQLPWQCALRPLQHPDCALSMGLCPWHLLVVYASVVLLTMVRRC